MKTHEKQRQAEVSIHLPSVLSTKFPLSGITVKGGKPRGTPYEHVIPNVTCNKRLRQDREKIFETREFTNESHTTWPKPTNNLKMPETLPLVALPVFELSRNRSHPTNA